VKWKAPIEYANDLDVGTYWMAPAFMNNVEMFLDLGQIYDVYDIRIWFVLLPQEFTLWYSVVGFNVQELGKRMTSTPTWGLLRLEVRGTAFPARYIRVNFIKSYEDPEAMMGTSVRDIAIYQFRNLAEGMPTIATNTWSYPAEWAANGLSTNWWMSRFNAEQANLYFDLGRERNIAGISFEFEYPAGHYTMYYSSDNVTWTMVINVGGNAVNDIEFPTNKYHFRGRYVRLQMQDPVIKIDHPDIPGNFKTQGSILALRWLRLMEHKGGGGVVGIQSLDGSEFDTIVWGQRQPGEWMLGSEREETTQDVGGGAYDQDIGNPAQIVVTFETVHSIYSEKRAVAITMYRNGLPYGDAYTVYVEKDRLRRPYSTRMVFGVRSSYYPNNSNSSWDDVHIVEPTNAYLDSHAASHEPYYWGKVYNATLIQNALSPEEVLGLYAVTKGGMELGCHCYDACPFGANRFNRSVLVPCSGQGVCLRNKNGIPLGRGECQCLPGYSGLDCSQHCSDLSPYGCCKIDDDCPSWTFCNTTSKACQNTTTTR
jgi:hypothetical protein